jgi:hypothetical protein
MSQAIFWTAEEVAAKAKQIYQAQIRSVVETPDNIGKMLIVDVETGEYSIDDTGVESSIKLKEKRPMAILFMFRIGFDVAVNFGN